MHRRALLRAALAVPLLGPRRTNDGGAEGVGPSLALRCSISRQVMPSTPDGLVPPPFSVILPIPVEVEGPDVVLEVAEAMVELIPGVATTVLAYNGSLPGPTVIATPERPTNLSVVNRHQATHVVHLHGGHVPADSDGHPLDTIEPGQTRIYRYPNRQRPATLWYHDHTMMRTAVNIYRGQAGLYLIRDPAEAERGLPVGGRTDIPLMLHAKTFGADGQLVYPDGLHDGFFGDVALVNGAPQPLASVPAGLIRLRVANAANGRPFRLQRSDGVALLQIASDGGLLAEPRHTPTIELWPAERVEILLDLRDAVVGDEITLLDQVQFRDGLVRFVVDGPGSRTPPPTGFDELDDLGEPVLMRDVTLDFDQDRQTWLLNGHAFDLDVVDAYPRMGEVERWRFTNNAPGNHPVHLHQTHFRVRARRSVAGTELPLEPGDIGWKDTVIARPGQTVDVDTRFADFPGTFVYHCHILEHEDFAMMSQLRVVPVDRLAGASRVETAIAAAVHAFPDGAPTVVVASGDTFADALAAGPLAAALRGALLLVSGDSVSTSLIQEVHRLAPERIIVAGGVRALSDRVLDALSAAAPVERVAGGSRDATAAALSRRAFDSAQEVWIATGADFPDALAGGAAAAAAGAPILLASRDALPPATAQEIMRLGATRAVMVGGPSVLGGPVEGALSDLGLTVSRLAGPDRFATAAAVAAHTYPDGPSDVVVLASGTAFPDALVAAPLAAALRAPILLVGAELPPVTAQAITRLAPQRLVVIGGESAVSLNVEQVAADLLDVGQSASITTASRGSQPGTAPRGTTRRRRG